MPVEVKESNVQKALDEIDRNSGDPRSQVPLEERGGEVLEQVNDVFNLMAMKIKMNQDARSNTA